MKTINVTFENWEYERLLEKKGNHSWHDFIMTLTEDRTPVTEEFKELKKDVEKSADKLLKLVEMED